MISPRVSLRSLAATAGLIGLAALLFAVAFPNPVARWGIVPLAFVAVTPLAVALRRMRWWSSALWGAVYGFAAYALFNYWLANFHPLAIFIVPVIYAAYFLLVMPALWLADRVGGRWRWLLQTLVWLAYEWLRTLGFLGYAYGILGYAIAPVPELIQIADLTGVWGLSLLVVMPGFVVAQMITDRSRTSEEHEGSQSLGRARGIAGRWIAGTASALRSVVKVMPVRVGVVAWAALFVLSLVYGMVARVDYSQARRWDVALVQQNVDPWRGGFRTYERSLEILTRESDAAIEAFDPDVVVWSETSFVPSIDYHTRFRVDQERYRLVRELRDYLEARDVPFVVGNSDGQLRRGADGELAREDYNAVLVFDAGGAHLGTYRKMHLVPFTEHFPYRDQLPWLYRILVENDTTFWEEGSDWTIFELDGIRFATPICFEDTFGYLSRGFVQRGAEVIVNLTNDLWSYSEPAAMQHMLMAVVRAVENRRSLVRSTNGGMTVIVDPNGQITDMMPAFVEGYLTGSVPVYTGTTTLYTAWGDWFAVVLSIAAFVALCGAVARALLVKHRN